MLEGVFAGAGVDAGTRHLLRWLADERFAGAASRARPRRAATGRWASGWRRPPRPAGAGRRPRRPGRRGHRGAGADRNGLADRVEAVGSLGYDDVGPTRASTSSCRTSRPRSAPPPSRHLLLDARHHLERRRAGRRRGRRPAGRRGRRPARRRGRRGARRHHPTKAYTAFEYRFVGVPAGLVGRARLRAGRLPAGPRRASRAGLADAGRPTSSLLARRSSTRSATARLAAARAARPPRPLRPRRGRRGRPGPPRPRRCGPPASAARCGSSTATCSPCARRRPTSSGDAEVRRAPPPQPPRGRRPRAVPALAVVGLPEREPVAVTAAVLGAALRDLGARRRRWSCTAAPATSAGSLELLPRHGARLSVERPRRATACTARSRAHIGRNRPPKR